jgi:YesN/AraC family two-component response regulator
MKTRDNSTSPRARILLADDDTLFRTGFARLLQSEGYDCVCAADAAQALEFLRTSRFDALISDIFMPGNVELELIQSIPQIAAGLPVILLTGRPTMDTAVKSVNLSVAGYLVKPPDLAELRRLLDKAIEAFRACQKIAENRGRFEQWARDLGRLEKTLKDSNSSDKVLPVAQYLHLMSMNFAIMLDDMERTMELLSRWKTSDVVFREKELIEVLQRTIEVIERTKQSFKSKRLGRLRAELQLLLQQRQP